MNEVVWLILALVIAGVLWLVGKRLSHIKENFGKKENSPDDIYPLF
jgi:hypothetical protein|tara:strand:+ start:243 stop:380 length:138 start_codon:yes stop_codon:yes gene_type:complete